MSEEYYSELQSKMDMPLITDGTRCELIKTDYHPFILGGNVSPTIQCPNKATFKITALSEQEKHIPPMHLCSQCCKIFKRDNKEYLSDYKIESLRSTEAQK